MTTINTSRNRRVIVDPHDAAPGSAWLRIESRPGGLSAALTRAEAVAVRDALDGLLGDRSLPAWEYDLIVTKPETAEPIAAPPAATVADRIAAYDAVTRRAAEYGLAIGASFRGEVEYLLTGTDR